MKRLLVIIFTIIGITACTEKMMIEPQEGQQLVGVSGSITDVYMKQEVVLSYTTPFYGTNPEMISDATVYVVDGIDTIWYEESERPGYYYSVNEFAGQVGHNYHLSIDFYDQNGHQHFYSESTMNENVEQVDSIRIKPWVFNDLHDDNFLGVYPYFLTTDNPKTYYMTRVLINGNDVGGDTLTRCMLFETYGYAGIYFNGPFMVMIAGEVPIDGLDQRDSIEVLHRGDTVTMDLWSVPREYAHYISEISASIGTNPMMGTPSNVSTNIKPDGLAVGCFHASSRRRCSVIY